MTEKIEELNQQITTAIFELEKVARKLSNLEEEMAKLTKPQSVEGRVARRGAVRTAVLGRDENRAAELLAHYLSEDETDVELKCELLRIGNGVRGY